MRRFNEWLALRTVAVVGTMECAYAFALLVLVPVFKPDWQLVVLYISSTVLQLVLLPLIMVGQSVVERRMRKQADEDHAALLEVLATVRSEAGELRTDTRRIKEIAEALHVRNSK